MQKCKTKKASSSRMIGGMATKQFVKLHNTRTPLHPDLIPYLHKDGNMVFVKHPFVIEVGLADGYFGYVNHRYLRNKQAVAKALRSKNWNQYFLLVEKTLLTELIARELCTECHVELAQNIGNIGQMQGLLMMLEPEHILLIDEIHELSETVQVSLYRALEERKLFLSGNRKAVTLPPFTLIGATTDEYLLTTSMRDRFKILLRLQHYSDDEMLLLISQRATRLGWEIDLKSVQELAYRSRGVPRLAVRLLDSAKRTASSKSSDTIEPSHVAEMLAIEGFDSLGFDPVEQRYLTLLKEHQGAVRLNVIATHLGLVPPRSCLTRSGSWLSYSLGSSHSGTFIVTVHSPVSLWAATLAQVCC